MKQPWHLTLELMEADPVLLADMKRVYEFLHDAPETVKMTRITFPHVFPYQAEDHNEWGITGTVILAQSHVSAHSYPNKGTCFIDCFSCEVFDPDKIIELARETFEALRYKFMLIDRKEQIILDKGEVTCYNTGTKPIVRINADV